ncbi:uncharacterized protein LOC113318043 isoform X2 [Papaver somniferum]|uniref:uncharacterized protein LOC113318043 isoform X2 n=1 Tax=Papaver somniferum TaxID=3469 RepID=UPI000E6FB7A9|nr:uncharacterized protein LOC113318043 isoform X2 [Papaver somniferum]
MSSIRNQKAGPLSVHGCVIHLLYLFASHSNYFNQENKKFPRMARWTLKELTLKVDMKIAVSMLSKSLIEEGWSEEERRLTLESVIPDTGDMSPDRTIKLLKNQLIISQQLLAKREEAYSDLQSKESFDYDFVEFVRSRKQGLESLKSRGHRIPEDKYRSDLYEIFNRMKDTFTTSLEEDSDTENQDSEEDATKKKPRGRKLPSLDGNKLLHKMNEKDKMRISSFWKHATTMEVVFHYNVNAVLEAKVSVIVLGSTLKELLFDDLVDAQAIQFYTLRRRIRVASDRQNKAPKYRNCVYFDPYAWHVVCL